MADTTPIIARWKDDPSVWCPDGDEIATALQDRGKTVVIKRKSGDDRKQKFPLLEKLANKVYASLMKAYNPEGCTKNISRGRIPLYKELILSRRHVDVVDTDPFFHKYATDGKVYLIQNVPLNSGIDQAIDHFQDFCEQQS